MPKINFNIRQLFLLMLLTGLVVAILSSAINQQPMQNYAAICFSSDGNLLAMMGNENTRVYDLQSGRIKRSIRAGGYGIGGTQIIQFKDNDTLAFFCEGKIASGLPPGVYFYSIPEGKLSLKVSTTAFNEKAAISESGVAIRDETTYKVDFFRFDTDQPFDADISNSMMTFAVRKSDDRIWLSNDGNFITFFSGFFQSRRPGDPLPTPSSQIIATVPGKPTTHGSFSHGSAILSPDNRHLVLSSNFKGVHCLERETQKEIWQYGNANSPEDMRFSRDGSTVVFQGVADAKKAYDSDRYIVSIDAETGTERFRIDTQNNMDSPFAVSPDGNFVAVATERYTDHGVELWDVKNKKMVGVFGGGSRSLKLWLYPLLASLWPLAWLKFGREKPANFTKPSLLVTIGLVVLWSVGLLVTGYAISFDLIVLSRFGRFGAIALGQQIMICTLSTLGMLTGIAMMVLALPGLGSHFRKQPPTIR